MVDRDKALIPPNWDSWAKIRLLNEFDIEGLSNAWSVEIQDPPEETSTTNPESTTSSDPHDATKHPLRESSGSAVAIFEATLPAPTNPSTAANPLSNPSNEVSCPDVQTYLASQAEVLERLKIEDDKEDKKWQNNSKTEQYHDEATRAADEAKMAEQIGPVQFNVGGIQVDAEEAVRGLKVRVSLLSRYQYTLIMSYRSAKRTERPRSLRVSRPVSSCRRRLAIIRRWRASLRA